MKTLALTAIPGRLICHSFSSEAEALKALPFIKRWQRETWDSRAIRYHSKAAIEFWDSILGKNDGFLSTEITYVDGKKFYKYYGTKPVPG